MVNCGCAKSSRPYQCSMKASFECESPCEKLLNCTIHKCSKNCHQGDCGECQEMILCACFCGSDKKEIPCVAENLGVTSYACEKECGKTLSCENHKCLQKCHEGPCKECQLMPKFIKNCPCGKTSIKDGERTSCLDEIKTCSGKCSKPLKCGPLSAPHKCMSNCHNGDCPPCTQTSKVRR
jgi:transcriptional repressor NF-X1